MTDPANDPRALRPEVVLLLLDTGQAAGGTDDGAACHADGRLLDPGELALIQSLTARVARVTILPELPPRREEAERLLPVLDPASA
jgi:hypothetical protein